MFALFFAFVKYWRGNQFLLVLQLLVFSPLVASALSFSLALFRFVFWLYHTET